MARHKSSTCVALAALCMPLLAQAADSQAVLGARAAIRTKEFARAAELLRPAASASDAQAQYLLASLMRVGLGAASDQQAARALLRAAAEQNHPAAAYALAASYANDEPLDRDAAAQWLQRAASAGHPLARSAVERRMLPLQFLPHQHLSDASSRRAAFWLAAQRDDVDSLEALADRDLISATDEFGRGAVARAAEAGASSALQSLLSRGANANQADAYGVTPLMLAASRADLATIDLLVRAQAATDAVDRNGNTALMYAAGREDDANSAIVERLLAISAQPTARNAQGWSALDWAIATGNAAAEAVLREHGVPARAVTAILSDAPSIPLRHAAGADLYRSWSDAQIAASRSTTRLLEALQRETADAPTPTAALHTATVAESPALQQLLATVRPDAAQAGTMLRWAIRHATPATVQTLLKHGVSAKRESLDAEPPLIVAVQARRPGIANLLLEHGADVDETDAEGRSALMIAAASGQHEIVAELLEHLARVDTRDASGRTALWYAAAIGNETSVLALLRARSAVDQSDRLGQTPLAIAASKGRSRVVVALLAAGADPASVSANGGTPLIVAVRGGDAETIRLLLERKAALDAQNRHGDTALITAARHARADVVRMLLAAGASTKLRNADRMSALDVANALGLRDIERALTES